MKINDEIESIYEGVEAMGDEFLRQAEAANMSSDYDTAKSREKTTGFVTADGTRYDADGLPAIDYDDYSPEELRELFDGFAAAVRGNDKAAKDEAFIKSWKLLQRWVDAIIHHRFSSYIASFNDRDNRQRFFDAMESEGKRAVLLALGSYESSKGAPSTYFGYAVLGALKHSITNDFHQVRSYQPELVKKIEEADKLFAEEHITPSIKDYQIATGLSIKAIQSVIAYRNKRKGDLSFDTACANVDMTDYTKYRNPDEEAISRFNMDLLSEILDSTLDAEENACFRYFADDVKPSAIAAILGMELSLVKEKISSAQKKLKQNRIVCSLARQHYGNDKKFLEIGFDPYSASAATESFTNAYDEFMGFSETCDSGLKRAKAFSAAIA